jgi:hypothetical protein
MRVTGLGATAFVRAASTHLLLAKRLGIVLLKREAAQSSLITMPRRMLCTTF